MQLIVFIKSSGPNINSENIRDTIISFAEKNKGVDYKFYIVADEPVHNVVSSIFEHEVESEKLLCLCSPQGTWAEDFNIFLSKHKNSSEWLLISHDDVMYVTDNYFERMTEPLRDIKDSIGWITSTNEQYFRHMNQMVVDTFRPGQHIDSDNWPFMFQIHNGSLENLDYPEKPVQIHGIMSAVMLIPMKSMIKIGECENWSDYTMLIDEDWSLRALQNNLKNVWVPDVHHLHPLRPNQRKVWNRFGDQCRELFEKKWGFVFGKNEGPQGCSMNIEEFREKFAGTLIPWSSYRKSYEWVYLDE